MIYIILFIFINAWLLFRYYKRPIGVFEPPFLMACISLTVLLPQLASIFYSDFYPNSLIPLLGYTMISGNLFFTIGYEKGIDKYANRRSGTIIDLNYGNNSFGVFLFITTAFACYSLSLYAMPNADMVAAANFKGMAFFAIALSLIAFKRTNKKKYLTWFVIASIPIVNFIFFIKGSRGDSLVLFLNIFFFLSLYDKWRGRAKKLAFIFLLLGSVLSASISMVRQNIHGNEYDGNTNVWENYKESFVQNEFIHGMDLGNAALLIDYCYENSSYTFGMSFWNNFVYNYVPKRFFGENVKRSLMMKDEYEDKVEVITCGITTTTCYSDAFHAFSIFGFVLFFIVGYGLGYVLTRMFISDFYLFLYFQIIGFIPVTFTHSMQYLFARFEYIFIFILPFMFLLGICKKRVVNT